MARTSAATEAAKQPEKVVLVSPDGENEVDVTDNVADDVRYRFMGYLPQEQQKLEAPEPVTEDQDGPKTVGTNGTV